MVVSSLILLPHKVDFGPIRNCLLFFVQYGTVPGADGQLVFDSNLVQLLKAMFSAWLSSKGMELVTERSPWRVVEAVESSGMTDKSEKVQAES